MNANLARSGKHSASRVWEWTALISGIAAVLCFGFFALIGSTLDAQGVLHEPFFLVHCGWALLFVCLDSAVASFAAKCSRSRS